MTIIIRHEQPEDYKLVENVAREAFWNLYIPGCVEHLIINKMRTHADFIPQLSFIIEVNGEIAGSIFYTHSKIVTKDGTEHKSITFGPVSILPKYHRQGIGRKLITHSIEEAKKLGYRAILTLGYAYHYEPYGFLGGKTYHISMEDGNFYKGLLVLPLYEDALNEIEGYAIFSDAFNDPSKAELEAFDQAFEYKEKLIQDSQKEYEAAVVLLDE